MGRSANQGRSVPRICPHPFDEGSFFSFSRRPDAESCGVVVFSAFSKFHAPQLPSLSRGTFAACFSTTQLEALKSQILLQLLYLSAPLRLLCVHPGPCPRPNRWVCLPSRPEPYNPPPSRAGRWSRHSLPVVPASSVHPSDFVLSLTLKTPDSFFLAASPAHPSAMQG